MSRKLANFVVLLLVPAFLVGNAISVQAAPKAGAKCPKAGTKQVSGLLTFTCVKSGKKAIWSKGVPSSSSNSTSSNSNSGSGQATLEQPCAKLNEKASIPNGTAICKESNGKLIWLKLNPDGSVSQSNAGSGNNPQTVVNEGDVCTKKDDQAAMKNGSAKCNEVNGKLIWQKIDFGGENRVGEPAVTIGGPCPKSGNTGVMVGGTAICAMSGGSLKWVDSGNQPIPTDGKWIYNLPGSDKWNTDLPPPGWSGELPWFSSNWDVPTSVSIGNSCPSKTFLTNYITDIDQLDSITPQGFMQPGVHAMPVPHMYYNTGQNTEKDPNGVAYRSKLLNLYAPADMTLYSVVKSTLTNADGYKYVEYMLSWHFCETYWMFNAHVGWLSPEIMEKVETAPSVLCRKGGQLNSVMDDCVYDRFALKIKAGTLFGKASGRAHGFDFGFTDASKPLSNRIDPKVYATRWAAGLCHINYYPEAMRAKLNAKLAGNNGCGQLVSDVAGTAQGVWLAPGKESTMEDYHVALAKHWTDKDLLAFSFGWNSEVPGISGGVFTFKPNSIGPSNKPFTYIKDGEIACYDNLQGTMRTGEPAPTIYIKLITGDIEKLTIAKGSGSCGSGPYSMPTSSQTFQRRVKTS